MTLQLIPLALALTLATPIAWSHGNEKHPAAAMPVGRDTTQAEISVPAEASAAVATVERFSAALSTGDMAAASAELDPAVLILESGGVERSRDEYLGGHAKSDAEFLKAAKVTLKRRTAKVSGDLVWVASESAIHAMKGEQMLMIDSTETMVVQKTTEGWKIVHIHWSSRRADAAH
jgi:ketosteroid isomerase-like protein